MSLGHMANPNKCLPGHMIRGHLSAETFCPGLVSEHPWYHKDKRHDFILAVLTMVVTTPYLCRYPGTWCKEPAVQEGGDQDEEWGGDVPSED